MNQFVSSLLSFPFSHISSIKKLTKQQLFLMQSPLLYPAYPLMLVISGISNLILSAWMIYDFIHRDIHSCYSGVTLGIQILACIYPLYQLMMFLVLLVTIAKVKYTIIRLLLIALFPIILTSFGFGGLGIVYSCMVHAYDYNAIPYTFLIQNYFIQIIVYCMLVFVVLYVVLVPLTVWLEERRDKNKERTGCECCLFAMSIVFQVLLLVGFVVFLAIAIGGIPVLFYLLNGIRRTQPLTQQVFYGMAINSLVSPFAVFCLAVFFTRVIGCGSRQQQMRTSLDESNELATQQAEQSHTTYNNRNSKQDGMTLKRRSIDLDDEIVSAPDSSDSKRQVLLESHLNRDFGEEGFASRSTRNNKSNLHNDISTGKN